MTKSELFSVSDEIMLTNCRDGATNKVGMSFLFNIYPSVRTNPKYRLHRGLAVCLEQRTD